MFDVSLNFLVNQRNSSVKFNLFGVAPPFRTIQSVHNVFMMKWPTDVHIGLVNGYIPLVFLALVDKTLNLFFPKLWPSCGACLAVRSWFVLLLPLLTRVLAHFIFITEKDICLKLKAVSTAISWQRSRIISYSF